MKSTPRIVRRLFSKVLIIPFVALTLVALTTGSAVAWDDKDELKFDMVSSAAFLPDAHGRVRIESVGPVEIMNVKVWGLPPNTDFDFFVIQAPRGPNFGLCWYQGDIE